MQLLDVISNPVIPVGPTALCGEVYERFQHNPTLAAVPVLDRGRPVGLLKRIDFLTRLADRFGRPLYERKPVTDLMDPRPLIVESSLSMDALNLLLVDAPEALQDGFIITKGGYYDSIGTAYTLLQANMAVAENRMRELDQARMEAEAGTRARTQFLANMSHELRTPLNAIIGFADFILAEQARGRAVEQAADYVGDIRDSGKHLLGVINAILDLSKLEANAFVLREDFECPRDLAEDVVRMVSGMARARSISLALDGDTGGTDLYGDPQVIKQILINLVSNAIKFSPDGAAVSLTVRLSAEGRIEYLVCDEGPGMDAATIVRVQEPFVQADAGLARKHDGTGLGLPLVKAFTEAHQGRFLLASRLGEGTHALVSFPPDRTVERRAVRLAVI